MVMPDDVPLDRPAVPAAMAAGGVVAVARRLEAGAVPAIVDALVAGGIGAFEVTLDEPEDAAIRALEAAAGHVARRGLPVAIGAGTVRSVPAARRALAAGASFLVAPHLDVEVVQWATGRGAPMLPGAATPTEVLGAWRAGAAAVKVFPASALGPSFVRELRGPFPDIPLQPTGGITVDDAGDFIRAGAIAVGIGSWLFAGGDPRSVRDRARQVSEAVRVAREAP
jgi:2-dehydro-3-deoxyphosphogluconate aldolase/(4S)-4-hydroxy-2-oxoglutarate aldolase